MVNPPLQQLAPPLGFNVLQNQCRTPAAWKELPEGTRLHVLDPARDDIQEDFKTLNDQYELNPMPGSIPTCSSGETEGVEISELPKGVPRS